MADPSSLANIAEQFAAHQIEWKKLSITDLLQVPVEYLKHIFGEDFGGDYYFSLSVLGSPATISLKTGNGHQLAALECRGIVPLFNDVKPLMQAAGGEITVEYSDMLLGADEVRSRGFNQTGIYYVRDRAFLEHAADPESGRERIVRAHFYEMKSGIMQVVPFWALAPFSQFEEWIIGQAAKIELKEKYYPALSQSDEMMWSELACRKSSAGMHFRYSLTASGIPDLDIAKIQRAADIFNAMKSIVKGERAYIAGIRRI